MLKLSDSHSPTPPLDCAYPDCQIVTTLGHLEGFPTDFFLLGERKTSQGYRRFRFEEPDDWHRRLGELVLAWGACEGLVVLPLYVIRGLAELCCEV
jgi:hypothetical protein